jgi:hypothetical protein
MNMVGCCQQVNDYFPEELHLWRRRMKALSREYRFSPPIAVQKTSLPHCWHVFCQHLEIFFFCHAGHTGHRNIDTEACQLDQAGFNELTAAYFRYLHVIDNVPGMIGSAAAAIQEQDPPLGTSQRLRTH